MDNPPETSRSYSTVYGSQAPGTGHARSMINSAQAWSAGPNTVGQWMQMDVGSIKYITGVKTQQRGTGNYQRVNINTS